MYTTAPQTMVEIGIILSYLFNCDIFIYLYINIYTVLFICISFINFVLLCTVHVVQSCTHI